MVTDEYVVVFFSKLFMTEIPMTEYFFNFVSCHLSIIQSFTSILTKLSIFMLEGGIYRGYGCSQGRELRVALHIALAVEKLYGFE